MTKALGFGFIGAGAIAGFHARAVAAANGGRLIGVASRRRSAAEDFAREHGMSFASDDVNQLLKQPGLDAVCITTPSALHLEPALAAIRAGKHLMIEKPIDSTVEGTDHILDTADKAACAWARYSRRGSAMPRVSSRRRSMPGVSAAWCSPAAT